jgi:hypothetical protein
VAELALGTSGDFSWKQNTTTTPTLRHGHVYEVSYHIDGGTVMADEDSWFQFHIGETLGRKHYGGAGAEETGTVLTELIQAEQPPEAGTLTFEVYGDMQDAADILRFASIQISEVVPDPMELHVELSKRDFV